MSRLCASETPVSSAAEQLKNYWRFFGEKRFAKSELAIFDNGYFKVHSPSWCSITVFDNSSRCFIRQLKLAYLPYLTFHVFGNGYMAIAKDDGYIEIYAPDGKFFARRNHLVKWWGEASAYVYAEDGNYYLADAVNAKEPALLGRADDILNVEQNINGLTAVKYYNDGYAVLFNAEMEPVMPVKEIERILFLANGSFILYANGVYYLYNAKMECLLKARFEMRIVDGVFCMMRGTLYDSVDGSVVDPNNKPVYAADSKFIFKDGGLFAEDGRQILAHCPVLPQVFGKHFLHLYLDRYSLVFDLDLSVAEMRHAILEVLFGCDSEYDISEDMFRYFQLIETCMNGHKQLRKEMLQSFLSD